MTLTAPADRAADLAHFRAAIDGVRVIDDPHQVRLKSRDFFWYSPLLKEALEGKIADLVVCPRDEGEVVEVARAVARFRVPVTVRGGGTGNYGQAVPLQRGIVLDMTALDRVEWVRPGRMRVQAGCKLVDIDAATRPEGWELRMFPSTKRTATIGGFVAGGSGGVGSIAYGALREVGNVLAARIVTIEDEPQILELRDDAVAMVNHAWGTTGIMTALEIPLAPVWPWLDIVVSVDNFASAVRLGHRAALADGIVSSSQGTLNFARNDVPAMAIAAIFQKDPQVLIAHPDVGINSFADMKGKPIAISRLAIDSYWPILAKKYGFSNSQIRPYTFQIGPFLVDKNLVQQGYATAEPFAIETKGHFTPKVFLIADGGYKSYATVMEATTALIKAKPDLVQRMVDATIEGWYSYLDGDPTPANNLIKKANPDMTDAQIAFSYGKMKELGLVDSGDAKTLGIGAMTDARWKSFFEAAAAVGQFPKDMDYRRAYTLQFVDKKHGMNPAN